MKKITQYTLAGLTLSLSSLQAYDKDLETLYPESTMLYGKVNSIQSLSELDKEHPIAKLLAHKSISEYVGGIMAKDAENMKDADKEVAAFFKKHCHDRASLGIINVGIGKANAETTNTKNSQNVAIGMSMDYFNAAVTVDCKASQEEFDDFLKILKDESPGIDAIDMEDFEGASYSIIESSNEGDGQAIPKTYLALVDELLVLTIKEETMKDFIGKVNDPKKEKTLADSPKYQDAADKLKQYDFTAFARFDQVYDQLIENEETSLLNHIEKSPQLKMMISSSAIKNDLHLDAFDSAFFGAKVTDEGAELKSGFSVKSQEGIAGLFKYAPHIPEVPKFAFEGFKSMDVSSYDLGGSVEQLEKMINKVSPMGFMLAKSQFGELYSLTKTNLIENLEPYYVTLSGHIDQELQMKRQASNIHVLKVKNDKLVDELINKIIETKPDLGITSSEFLEEKVYQIPGENGISYFVAVVKNHLVIAETGEDAMWRHVVSQIKTPGKAIDSHKTLADMWDSMENGEVSMSYQDIGQLVMEAYFEKQKQAKDDNDVPDVSDLHYSLVSKFYQQENFWYSDMKLQDYSPQQK